MSSSVSKIVAERNRRTLLELVLKPGNDVCADCKARAPRWASHNLGIFICVSCASIHRKIGTHITKVKSITLDEWTKDQVEVMKENGNIKSNALYNPNETRHPPPTNMVDSERDSELEKFIRSKYEYKRFMDRKPGGTTFSAQVVRNVSPGPPPPPKTPQNLPPRLHTLTTIPSASPNTFPPARSASQPLPPLNADKLTNAPPIRQQPAATQKPAGEVWDDLISLRETSQSSSLPLQYNPSSLAPMMSFPSHPQAPIVQPLAVPSNPPNPFMNLPFGQTNVTSPLAASPLSISAPATPMPFVSPVPLSSPTLHTGATNPFSQRSLLSSPSIGVSANTNTTAFATSSNPFSSVPLMTMSTPTTPIMAPAMVLPVGGVLHTPSLPYHPSQTPMQASPALSFSSPPFAPALNITATAGIAQNPLAPVSVPGRIPHSIGGVTTNSFSSMQAGQAGFSGAGTGVGVGPSANPQTAFLNQPQYYQQQQPHGFGGWGT